MVGQGRTSLLRSSQQGEALVTTCILQSASFSFHLSFARCKCLIPATISPMVSGFQCAACGEWNETVVDESAGGMQSYVEDCQVCCRPNLLAIRYDPGLEEFMITAQLE